uniref:Uncharacterized protein n=1 Tax=Anguilla anguilla TaxID=7936 RepID=A0A0E9W5N7_ANGAN
MVPGLQSTGYQLQLSQLIFGTRVLHPNSVLHLEWAFSNLASYNLVSSFSLAEDSSHPGKTMSNSCSPQYDALHVKPLPFTVLHPK